MAEVLNDFFYIEIRHLRPPQYPSRGFSLSGTISMVHTCRVLDIDFELHNVTAEGYIHLRYTVPVSNKEQNCRITLDHTPAHFGGYRTWFIFPETGARAAKLYLDPERGIFVSQRAIEALYASQMYGDYDRAVAMKHKLAGRLEEPYLSKPKGMHYKTYAKILDRYEHYDRTCKEIIAKRMEAFSNRFKSKI